MPPGRTSGQVCCVASEKSRHAGGHSQTFTAHSRGGGEEYTVFTDVFLLSSAFVVVAVCAVFLYRDVQSEFW